MHQLNLKQGNEEEYEHGTIIDEKYHAVGGCQFSPRNRGQHHNDIWLSPRR